MAEDAALRLKPGVPIIFSAPFFDEREAADDTRSPRPRDYRWLVGIWVVVAGFAAIMLVRSAFVDVPVRDPGNRLFADKLAMSAVLFGVLCLVDAVIRARRELTVVRILEELRRRWPVDRLLVALSGLLAYQLVYVCYRNLKSWLAFRDMQDGWLLDLDKWLFLGHDPAVVLHDLLGRDVTAHLIAAIYESFSYLVPLSFVAALVFAARIRDGYVFLAAALWAWILGTAAYYLIPSLGPFAATPDSFADLSRTFIVSKQDTLLEGRADFLQDPSAGDAFASIGAFASLHVGFTCMVMLMLRYYGFRRATRVMAVYLAATIVATLYLGYHYILDDIGGLLLGYLAVLLGRLTVYPRGRPAATVLVTVPAARSSGQPGDTPV